MAWHLLGCKDFILEVALQGMLVEYIVSLCSEVVHDHLRHVIFDVLHELWKWGKRAFFCKLKLPVTVWYLSYVLLSEDYNAVTHVLCDLNLKICDDIWKICHVRRNYV
jgi:hypothetical protein